MRRAPAISILACAVSLPSCAGDETSTTSDAFGPSAGDDDTADDGDGEDGTGADEGDGAGDPDGDDTADEPEPPETKFDIGAPDPDAPPENEPCEKVDLIFVVDNSGSMAGEQENLVNSFPGFVEEMQTTLETVDSLHIGAITTDAHRNNPPECQKLGAFVQSSAMHGDCVPFDTGKTWMTEDQTDLQHKFACVGQNGTGGDGNEKPMDAVQLALSDPYNAPDACNDGFLRDDALLVAVIITDEEDDLGNSQGDPPDWFDGVVAAKHGIETNVVVLALVGQEQPNECDGIGLISSDESAEPAPRIHAFTDLFTYGFHGDVCADSYQPFFHEAISVIDTACSGFTPPG